MTTPQRPHHLHRRRNARNRRAIALKGARTRYLRYGMSYRDMEELLAERGVTVAVYRVVQRFTPEFI